MRILSMLLGLVLGAALSVAPEPAVAGGTTDAVVVAAPAEVVVPVGATDAESLAYEARQAQAPEAAEFAGGQVTIVVIGICGCIGFLIILISGG